MTQVDIGLFDYDRHNALYYFVLNADEEIYLRYGGRDARGPEVYLNLDSLELALAKGLELHGAHNEGALTLDPRPAPRFPRDIPLLKDEVINWGRCVECHLIADYELVEKEFDSTLDKLNDLYRYPDIRKLGIALDIPKGLVVARVEGAAADAGLRAGDRILALNGRPVYTFADLQHYLDKVPKEAPSLTLATDREGKTLAFEVALPFEWWWTDLYHRYLTVDPNAYFSSEPLHALVKYGLGLNPEGFAARVTEVDPAAQVYMLHTLQVGDIVYAVDGVEVDLVTRRLDVHIKLHVESGDRFTAKILRDGESLELEVKTYREHFRKPEI